ncbi:hypothetical protein [Thermococcus sp. CX2]|uniref:hypothetical protein n=1 Tax=Thermococcus sp. CX2 TaxID=163006 RepID=UPI00143871E9|nr:hypothetical protein [Thermococcus sp. CX2]
MSSLKFQVTAFIEKGSTAFLWMVLVLIGISVALVGPVIRVLKPVREGERS